MDPVRTCVGCRGRAGATTLVRIGWDPSSSTLQVDTRKRLGGRGAWLHDSRDCFDLAVRRRIFGRALRRTVTPDDLAAVEASISR